jgi:hypothetical protein
MTRLQNVPLPTVATIFIGYILMGWLLAAYAVPRSTWLGTGLVTLYLAWAGTQAIAIAMGWIVGLVWVGACYKSWFVQIPWISVPVWAGALGFSWSVAIALTFALAFAQRSLYVTTHSKAETFCLLSLIAGLGLQLGYTVHTQSFKM